MIPDLCLQPDPHHTEREVEQVAAKATFPANLYVWELMAMSVPTFHIQFFHNMDFSCRIYYIGPPIADGRAMNWIAHRPDMRDRWLHRVHSNKVRRDQPSAYSNPSHKWWAQVHG